MNEEIIEDLPLEASYKEIHKFYTERECDVRLKERLRRAFTEKYDEDLANTVLKYLEDKTIEIVNPMGFFSKNVQSIDPSKNTNLSTNIRRYIKDIVHKVRLMESEGGVEFNLIELLITLTRYIENFPEGTDNTNIHELMDGLVLALSRICTASSRIRILVLDKELLEMYVGKGEMSYEKYYLTYRMLLNSLDRMFLSRTVTFKPPTVKFCRAVMHGTRDVIKRVCYNTLGLDKSLVENVLNHYNLFDKDHEDFEVVMDYLMSQATKEFVKEDFLENISYYLDHPYWSLYDYGCTLAKRYPETVVGAQHKVSQYCINIETFQGFKTNTISEVRINMRNFDINRRGDNSELEYIIRCAHLVNLEKAASTYKKGRGVPSKITFYQVKSHAGNLVQIANKMKQELESTYGRDMVFTVTQKDIKVHDHTTDYGSNTFIRIISDLHADINANRGYKFVLGREFVVCCGDISSDARTSVNWIKNNVERGVFIHGNHLGYSSIDSSLNYTDRGYEFHPTNTLNGQIKYLEETFKNDNNIHYLNNSCYEYEGIVFIGTCLYTDFSLYGSDRKDSSMNYAHRSMNDFRYPQIIEDGKVRCVTPSDHEKMHLKAKEFLWNATREHAGKPMVILTHHAPLPFSIADKYIGQPLNAAFTNDMRDLIKARPNIRIWAHGHTHSKFNYVYNNTRVICAPFGYYNENNVRPESAGTKVNIKIIRDRERWEKLLAGKEFTRYTDDDITDFI